MDKIKCTKPNCNCIEIAEKKNGGQPVKNYECLADTLDVIRDLNTVKSTTALKILTEYGDEIPQIPIGKKLPFLKWLKGKKRMFWKCCPQCNSSAPECDNCQVCHNNRELFYSWESSPNIRQIWWNRYVLKNTISPNLQTDISSEEWRQITGYEQM